MKLDQGVKSWEDKRKRMEELVARLNRAGRATIRRAVS